MGGKNNVKETLKRSPICNDSRKCFARNYRECRILYATYDEDGECPFCKQHIHQIAKREKK